ncbi:hypothetical protein HYS50_01255 [Candidatus Woesearchaeota archaeon]|nr:hypothetical protein [Candidatus Woesearchaeota archaeon]
MPEESTEIAKFIFGIEIIEYEDGRRENQTHIVNQNIPIELVIMQMRSYINSLETQYFDNFEKTLCSSKEE